MNIKTYREGPGKVYYGRFVIEKILAPPKPQALKQRLPMLVCIGLLGAVVVVVATALILLW